MLFNLKHRLSKMSRRAAPDRMFVMSVRAKLEKAGYLPARRLGWFDFNWQRGAIAFSLMTSLAVGTGAYAYSSPNVLPDHPLYSLRAALETVELSVASTPEVKGQVRLKQLQRHIDGARLLAIRNKPAAVQQTQHVLEAVAEEVARAGMDAEHPAVDPDQKEFLKATVDLDKEEFVAVSQQQEEAAQTQTTEDQQDNRKLVNDILVDETNQLEENVKVLQRHQRHPDKSRKEAVQTQSNNEASSAVNGEVILNDGADTTGSND